MALHTNLNTKNATRLESYADYRKYLVSVYGNYFFTEPRNQQRFYMEASLDQIKIARDLPKSFPCLVILENVDDPEAYGMGHSVEMHFYYI